MKAFACLLLILFSLQAIGAHAQSVFQTALAPGSRLAFDNSGGIANDGVCWWHSRLQRAFFYLARYAPNKPKPTLEKARELVNDLIWEKAYVEIPGFANTYEFSKAYADMFQHELNEWQISDGFFRGGFFLGMSGSSSLEADDMKERMDSIWSQYKAAFAKNDMLWVMLQMEGIASHASLIQHMAYDGNGGYFIQMVDSNYPAALVAYNYHPGDTYLQPENIENYNNTWVPYISYGRDLDRIHAAVGAHQIIR